MKSLAFALVLLAACSSKPVPSNPDGAPPAPDAAPPAPDAPPPLVTIGVGATACQGHADPVKQYDIGPVLPDEKGDPAVARITPPSYPFKVASISYQLTGMEAACGTNIAHSVSVYAGPTGDTPPTTPTSVQKFDVAGSPADQRTLVVTKTLSPPIVLTQGQDLFVAVEMQGNSANTISNCLDGCSLAADDKRQFWSEAPQPPYTWATLYSFGISADYAIWAQGLPQ